MMKIIFLVAVFSLFSVNSLAVKTITCKVASIGGYPGCEFSNVMIEQNEVASLETDPADADPNKIAAVVFSSSSIYSVPRGIFTKFPNAKHFFADGQNIQEIKADTFQDAHKLKIVDLRDNSLAFLHKDTFRGNFFRSLISHLNSKKFYSKIQDIWGSFDWRTTN
jgi:hypothetical protein